MTFNLNSELYAAPNVAEGIDYARRHRRHERFDDTLARTDDVPKTTILAPHGGGIEPGTSELCLAVAGYHPASLPQIPAAGVTYDYWMFEGLREQRQPRAPRHLDRLRRRRGRLAVRGLAQRPGPARLPAGPPDMSSGDQVVLVGGGNTILAGYLLEGLRRAGFDARDADPHGELNGDARCNIVNRTLLGMGAQLELSKPLREAMFTEHTRSRRKHTTTQLFWTFVTVCRDALDRLQAEQIVARPDLRCLAASARCALTRASATPTAVDPDLVLRARGCVFSRTGLACQWWRC